MTMFLYATIFLVLVDEKSITILIYVHSLAFLWTYIQLLKKKSLLASAEMDWICFVEAMKKQVECPSTLGMGGEED